MVSPPGMSAISPAAGAVPPQLLPVFQSVLVVPVHVLVAANNDRGKENKKDKKMIEVSRRKYLFPAVALLWDIRMT